MSLSDERITSRVDELSHTAERLGGIQCPKAKQEMAEIFRLLQRGQKLHTAINGKAAAE
jgi:hypothetical protein